VTGPARAIRIGVAGLLVALAAGCGVQLQEQAEPLPGGLLPTPTPTPTPTASEEQTRVFYVAGRKLEGVPGPVSERTPEGVMEALAAGPPVDRQAELRSLLLDPLTGTPLLVVSTSTPAGEVVIQRADGYVTLPATDQTLLTGQVVHSMAEIDLTRVIMIDAAGTPVPITLPDGRVQEGAVSAEDFEDLLTD
jgi:hypothetical protein